ncbi:hypothetical protein DL991_41010 [Amycolatopsis sp. WAC 01375]|uniref:hypothetical protein n=1 Tax=Amycolatopsis sp. WAC 01375 TaxID=2203194 RepID=UPI000F7B94CD|nr:hypothetical protein [Amycolatopsis sp. WAC 01375]RSM68956.1 hypothetical protein DL991_41010 [Amycolatopsis sp. WAC 01375]
MKVLCSVRTLFLLTIWAGGIGMILGVILIQSVTPSLHRADPATSVGDAPRAEAIGPYASAGITFTETTQERRSQ